MKQGSPLERAALFDLLFVFRDVNCSYRELRFETCFSRSALGDGAYGAEGVRELR